MITGDSIELGLDFSYEEELVIILDKNVQILRTKKITSVQVQRRHQPKGEATWETKSDI